MKVVAYNIRPGEKEYLAKANQKKHDITLISNQLTTHTAIYADGKDAVIVSNTDDVSADVIERLASLNIRFIITRSKDTRHFDKRTASLYGIKLACVLSDEPQEMADQTVKNLDLYQQKKCVGDNCACAKACKAGVGLNLSK